VYGNGWMIVGDSGGFVNAAPRRLQPGDDHRAPGGRDGDRGEGRRPGYRAGS
jgi:hypothetical protein